MRGRYAGIGRRLVAGETDLLGLYVRAVTSWQRARAVRCTMRLEAQFRTP